MSKFKGILQDLESCLGDFGYPVYYGRSFAKENDAWNYIVFNRQSFHKAGTNSCDINYQYQVHIIMENYIEEDLEINIIKAIQDNVRLKLTGSAQYNYVTKSNTDIVVEMVTLTFTKTHKGMDL